MNTLKLYPEILHNQNCRNTAKLYDEATEDYNFWSRDLNMHFGYYSPKRTNPFKRDTMLNEMNRQIFERLQPANKALCDLGCGMGATMRYGLSNYANLKITGVTLSNFQEAEGNKLLAGLNGKILKENYNQTLFSDSSFDGAYAIESFCHSGHCEQSFREAHRILKPGGRLVVADAFLKKELKDLCPGGSYCYNGLCRGWSLEKLGNIPAVTTMLDNIGFTDIRIEDISFRVAPSVLHVPFAIAGFLFRKFLNAEELKTQSINNLKGSLFALLSGIQMNNFGYYIITCTKQS
jgi:MPBQ/MSBQ methyltransferase